MALSMTSVEDMARRLEADWAAEYGPPKDAMEAITRRVVAMDCVVTWLETAV